MTDPNFSTATFEAELHSLASQHNLDSTSHAQIAALLDDADPLAPLRKEYNLPSMKGLKAALARKAARDGGGGGGGAPTSTSTSTDGDADGDADADADALYLCGNSLGPQARLSSTLLNRELAVWSSVGVLGHFDHPHDEPWLRADEACAELMADLVGAKRAEVACMGTLTGNLHTLLATFYRPGVEGGVRLPRDGSIKRDESAGEKGKRRHKIVYEWKAFPSDQYALQSVVRLAGLDPSTSLIALRPRPSEDTLRTSDILHTLQTLAAEGETALLMLSGIQYYTGQFFDMQQITRAARECGIVVGWDLAHAFANVPLALHDWDVDFAAWCTYKYGSSGPGGIAGLFVHERWTKGVGVEELPRPAGWFGHNRATRFAMPSQFDPIDGAAGFITSNPSALDLVVLRGSLETLARAPQLAPAAATKEEVGQGMVGFGKIMAPLRAKSLKLTAYLAHLLLLPNFLPDECEAVLVTPRDPHQRGSQLCVRIVDHRPSSSPSQEREEEEEDGEGIPPPLSPTSLLARAHARAEREHGLIVDVRAPDVIRLAPLAQYSTFEEVWRAAHALRDALVKELAVIA